MVSVANREKLTATAERYARALAGSAAETYLASRGFTPTDSAKVGLGLVTDPDPDHETMTGMLSLPYRTPAGVVGFKFRNLRADSEPKYLNPPGQSLRLFNVNAFHVAGDYIAISEGEIDALTLDVLCDIPAVSVPGAKAWNTRVHPRCFEGFRKVWIFADNDKREDGSNPGMDMAMRIRDSVPQATVVRMPPNTDVNALYLEQGREHVRSLISLD